MSRMFSVAVLATLMLAGAGWACSPGTETPPEKADQGSPEATEALRKMMLELTPEKAGITVPPERQVWGGAMDLSVGNGTVTVASLLDGTTSVYFSNGGGFIGGGQHESVRKATLAFVEALEGCASGFSAGSIQELPPANRARFYALSRSGLLHSEEVDVNAFASKSHSLRPCYAAAQEVITQMRLVSEQQGQR